jgi:hypothetical protein
MDNNDKINKKKLVKKKEIDNEKNSLLEDKEEEDESEEKVQEFNESIIDLERNNIVSPLKLHQRIFKILLSLINVEHDSIIRNCGNEIYYYLWFNKLLLLYCLVCGIIALSTILPIYLGSEDYVIYKDWASTTIGALGVGSYSSLHLLFAIIFPIVGNLNPNE